jgi:hypothetical protein
VVQSRSFMLSATQPKLHSVCVSDVRGVDDESDSRGSNVWHNPAMSKSDSRSHQSHNWPAREVCFVEEM